MPTKESPPSISETAFNCPHCGAFTTQFWYKIYVDKLNENETPSRFSHEGVDEIVNDFPREMPEDQKKIFGERLRKLADGEIFIERVREEYLRDSIYNLSASRCYNCNGVAIWLFNQLLYPIEGAGPSPNDDLPTEIKTDYEEASSILNISPRGAAALLRLAIQKLCKYLGEAGKDLNQDIGNLVGKGLDARIQKALDTVRVIGNNAVHPGQIDLKDGRDTAIELFRLVNIISEIMISQPKHIDEIYEKLPDSAKEQINKRDNKR